MTRKRSQKQLAAFWAGTNPKNIEMTNNFLNPKEKFVSRFVSISHGISPEKEESLRCLKLWLKVLGGWNGFYVNDFGNIEYMEKKK